MEVEEEEDAGAVEDQDEDEAARGCGLATGETMGEELGEGQAMNSLVRRDVWAAVAEGPAAEAEAAAAAISLEDDSLPSFPAPASLLSGEAGLTTTSLPLELLGGGDEGGLEFSSTITTSLTTTTS